MNFGRTLFLRRSLIAFILSQSINKYKRPTKANTPTMSLCFLDAFEAKQAQFITEDEYVGHMLAHFRGVRHPQDDGIDWRLEASDPIGASIRELALSTDYEPMKGIRASSEESCAKLDGRYKVLRRSLLQLY
jgi:hypothetical protein